MHVHRAHCAVLPLALLISAALVLSSSSYVAAQSSSSTDSAARDYYSANGLLNRGLFELAAQEYRKFLSEHPQHEKAPLAHYGLGVSLFKVQKYDECITALEPIKSNTQFQYAAEVQLILGQALLTTEQYDEAAAAFDQMLTRHQQHASADVAAALHAETLYRAGKYDAVDAACDLAMKRWPDSPLRHRAVFFAGLAAIALKNDALAVKRLSELREKFPDSEFAPQSAILLAQALHRQNQNDQALREYRQIIADGNGDAVAEALYGASSLLQQSDQPAAAKYLDQMFTQFPEHRLAGPALLLRGRLWFDAAEYQQAQQAFERSIESQATAKDEAHYWIAKCHMRRGEHAQAATLLERLLREYPNSALLPEAMYDRAVALVRSEDHDRADRALQQFCEEYASHTLHPDALYLHATLEHQRKNYARSAELCSAFLQKHAQHALASAIEFTAAENQLLLEKLPQAIEKYQQFLSRYPKHEQAATARYRMGSAMFRSQRFDEAEQALAPLAKGAQTPESFRRSLLMLGDIYFAAGRWDQAIAQLSDYLSFGDNQPSSDDAMLKVGLAQIRSDQAESALKTLQDLIAKFPESVHAVQARFERGQIFAARQDSDAAVEEFEFIAQNHRDSRFAPFALHHLGSIAMQQQQYERAAGVFAELAKVAVDQDQLAEAIFQRGQALMALREFSSAAAQFAILQRDHAAHARVPLASAQRSIALARENQHEDALNSIQQLEQSSWKNLDAAMQTTLLYEKAWCLRELKRADDAAAAYRALLKSHEDQSLAVNAMLELAELDSAADRHEAAAELLQRLRARIKSDDSIAGTIREQSLYRLAACRFQLNQFAECADLCDEFLKAHPESDLLASVHVYAGESRFKDGKLPQAAPHFAAIVEKHPESNAFETSLLRLGECLAAAQQWSESQAAYQKHLEKFPKSELWFQSQFGVAWARENQSNYDDAMTAYQLIVEKHSGPTAARAQFQIGECLFAKRQFEDAVRELLKVDILYAYPQWSAAALYEAGRCFEELGKHVEARAQFLQVQERFPDTRWSELAAQRLNATASRAVSGG